MLRCRLVRLRGAFRLPIVGAACRFVGSGSLVGGACLPARLVAVCASASCSRAALATVSIAGRPCTPASSTGLPGG
eukprot:1481806-Alexandrium_andersonii.AAC.1